MVVKASHACGVAAGDLMEAGAVDLGGGGGRESVGSVVGFVRAGVAQRMSGAEVCEALEDVERHAPFARGGLARCGKRVR